MPTNNELLAELNAFRVAEGKTPFADYRPGRHAQMLRDYRAAAIDVNIADTEQTSPISQGEGENTSDVSPDAGDAGNGEVEAIVASLVASHNAAAEKIANVGALLSGNMAPGNGELDGEGQHVADKAKSVKLPSYKEMANYSPSSIEKPVAFIHQWLANFGADMTRKQAVAALMAFGINYSTARTQYQRWYSKARVEATVGVGDANEQQGE